MMLTKTPKTYIVCGYDDDAEIIWPSKTGEWGEGLRISYKNYL